METFPLFEALSRHSLAVLALAQPPSGGGSCNGGSGTGNNVALTGGGGFGTHAGGCCWSNPCDARLGCGRGTHSLGSNGCAAIEDK